MNICIEDNAVSLRKAEVEDLKFVYELERKKENKQFIMPYKWEDHLQVMDNPDQVHLIVWAKAASQRVGFVLLAGLNNPNLFLELRRIVIEPKGLGWGRKTLELVKKYCFQALRFRRLWLDVFDDNQRALFLYKSAGFKEVGIVTNREDANDRRSLVLLSIAAGENENQ